MNNLSTLFSHMRQENASSQQRVKQTSILLESQEESIKKLEANLRAAREHVFLQEKRLQTLNFLGSDLTSNISDIRVFSKKIYVAGETLKDDVDVLKRTNAELNVKLNQSIPKCKLVIEKMYSSKIEQLQQQLMRSDSELNGLITKRESLQEDETNETEKQLQLNGEFKTKVNLVPIKTVNVNQSVRRLAELEQKLANLQKEKRCKEQRKKELDEKLLVKEQTQSNEFIEKDSEFEEVMKKRNSSIDELISKNEELNGLHEQLNSAQDNAIISIKSMETSIMEHNNFINALKKMKDCQHETDEIDKIFCYSENSEETHQLLEEFAELENNLEEMVKDHEALLNEHKSAMVCMKTISEELNETEKNLENVHADDFLNADFISIQEKLNELNAKRRQLSDDMKNILNSLDFDVNSVRDVVKENVDKQTQKLEVAKEIIANNMTMQFQLQHMEMSVKHEQTKLNEAIKTHTQMMMNVKDLNRDIKLLSVMYNQLKECIQDSKRLKRKGL